MPPTTEDPARRHRGTTVKKNHPIITTVDDRKVERFAVFTATKTETRCTVRGAASERPQHE